MQLSFSDNPVHVFGKVNEKMKEELAEKDRELATLKNEKDRELVGKNREIESLKEAKRELENQNEQLKLKIRELERNIQQQENNNRRIEPRTNFPACSDADRRRGLGRVFIF